MKSIEVKTLGAHISTHITLFVRSNGPCRPLCIISSALVHAFARVLYYREGLGTAVVSVLALTRASCISRHRLGQCWMTNPSMVTLAVHAVCAEG